MSEVTFKPAPGWPATTPGWLPPTEWTPPAEWPPAPEGWVFYQGAYGEPAEAPAQCWQPSAAMGPADASAASVAAPSIGAEVGTDPQPGQPDPGHGRRWLWFAGAAAAVVVGGAAVAWMAVPLPSVGVPAPASSQTPVSASASPTVANGPFWVAPDFCPDGEEAAAVLGIAKLEVTADGGTCQLDPPDKSGSWSLSNRGEPYDLRELDEDDGFGGMETAEAPELGPGALTSSAEVNIGDEVGYYCAVSVPATENPDGSEYEGWVVVTAVTSASSADVVCGQARDLVEHFVDQVS